MTCKTCNPEPIEPEKINTLPNCTSPASFSEVEPKPTRQCNEKIIVLQPDDCE